MKVFVWNNVAECTDRYHASGGVVVFAETVERARELANAEEGCSISPEELPDDVREICVSSVVIESEGSRYENDALEAVYIFPDSGCC